MTQIDPASLYESVGSSGLNRFGGTVVEELHPALKGRKAARVYREMSDNDPVIGAALFAMTALLSRVPWRNEPADAEVPEAVEAAKFLGDCIDKLETPWGDVVDEGLSMVESGWAFLETIHVKRPDGRLGWKGFYGRAQESLDDWVFDEFGQATAWFQCAAPDYKRVLIPIAKGVHFRTRSRKNNPEGRSLLRNAYTSWFFAKNLRAFEGVGVEREMAGLPCMEVPLEIMSPTATDDERAIRTAMETMVQAVRADRRSGLVVPTELNREGKPTGYRFRLVTSGGRRAIEPHVAIVRHEQRMLLPFLAQFLLLGMDKVGSFSLSSDQTDLFGVVLGSILDKLEEQFHNQATVPLMAMNGVAPEYTPRRKHGDIEKADIQALADALGKLVGGSLLTPDATLEDHVREMADLPPHDPETATGAGADMPPAKQPKGGSDAPPPAK